MSKELKNKPLVEAIWEIRWKLQGTPRGPQIDPHYKLLLGRLFDRMLGDYPEHDDLPYGWWAREPLTAGRLFPRV